MSEQASSVLPSPYRGILPFRYADRACFFGREREIQELTAKILLYRLVALFGDSGSGKSSLINAGIVPRLEMEGFQPERLRIRPFVESPFLVERISSGRQDSRFLPSVFADFAHVESPDSREIFCSLEGFKQAVSQASKEHPLVLILDQFEELFTLFDSSYRVLQARILEIIADAANQKDVAIKIVLGIREDFLGKLELIAREYPQVFDRRVRLGMLSAEAAKRAVIGPFEHKNEFSGEISTEAADAIIEEFAQGAEYSGIHPTQLQIVCSRLWDQHAGEALIITKSHFLGMNGVKGILEDFLESTTSALSSDQQDLVYQVLGQLITASGTRDVVSDARLKAWRSQETMYDEKALDAILDFLEEKRLINRTTQHGMFYFEVSSEYLVTPIQKYNRERECKEAERKAAESAAMDANEAARVRELEQARLLANEQARLAESERRKAEIEARTAKRLRRGSRILLGVAILALISLVLFVVKNTELKRITTNLQMKTAELHTRNRELMDKTAELSEAKRLLEENMSALEASLRAEQGRANLLLHPNKVLIEAYRDDIQIKQDALSGNQERLQNALSSHPSRIKFEAHRRPLKNSGSQGQMYLFELVPISNTVDGGFASLALITMLMNHPTFKNPIIAAGPDKNFVCSYEGWGCLNMVVVVIEFRDPQRRAEVTSINMCDLLSRKYGKMEKR